MTIATAKSALLERATQNALSGLDAIARECDALRDDGDDTAALFAERVAQATDSDEVRLLLTGLKLKAPSLYAGYIAATDIFTEESIAYLDEWARTGTSSRPEDEYIVNSPTGKLVMVCAAKVFLAHKGGA